MKNGPVEIILTVVGLLITAGLCFLLFQIGLPSPISSFNPNVGVKSGLEFVVQAFEAIFSYGWVLIEENWFYSLIVSGLSVLVIWRFHLNQKRR